MEFVNKDKIVTSLIVACAHSLKKGTRKKRQAPKMAYKTEVEDDVCICEPTIDLPHTFIMRWNPEISNHKLVDFEESMMNLYTHEFYYDWSIYDYKAVKVGDKFYMVKVGEGNTGIVMHGTIISESYIDEDWSGQGRDVRYVRMNPECMIHPDNKSLLISTEELDEKIPGIDWNHGHSGVMLTDEQALMLDSLWESRIRKNSLI